MATGRGTTEASGADAAGAEQAGRRGRVVLNTAYRAIGDLGSKVASIALFVVLAREVGDTNFGIYSFALAFSGLVITVGGLGQDAIVTREVARDRASVHRYFSNTIALRLVICLPALVLALAIATAVGMSAETRIVALLLGLGLVVDKLVNTCFAVYQGYERLQYLPVVLIFQRWLTAIAGVVALVVLGAGIETVAAIYLGSALLAFALALTFLNRRVVRVRSAVVVSEWWPLTRTALPIGLAGVFVVILARLDTAILAIYDPESVVGHYGAAYRVLEATLFVGWSVSSAVLPVFSRLGGDPRAKEVLGRSLKLTLALSLPLATAAAVLATPIILLLFGEEYRNGASAVVLLAPAIALYPLAYVASDVLIARDRQILLTLVYGGVAGVAVALNFILIPPLSLDGAALGTSISQLLVAAAMIALAARLAGRPTWPRVVAGPALASAAAAAVMLALQGTFLAAAVAGAGAYVIVLLAFERTLFPEDAAVATSFLRRFRSEKR